MGLVKFTKLRFQKAGFGRYFIIQIQLPLDEWKKIVRCGAITKYDGTIHGSQDAFQEICLRCRRATENNQSARFLSKKSGIHHGDFVTLFTKYFIGDIFEIMIIFYFMMMYLTFQARVLCTLSIEGRSSEQMGDESVILEMYFKFDIISVVDNKSCYINEIRYE